MLEEFKKFALKGNMVDLAIGIVIGAAFSGVVNSLVNDIIMPVIGAVTCQYIEIQHTQKIVSAAPTARERRPGSPDDLSPSQRRPARRVLSSWRSAGIDV